MNYLADSGYLAIKPETTEGVAVIPNIFLPFEECSLRSNLNLTPDRRIQGIPWETNDMSYGDRTHNGTIKLWLDPTTLGYVLDMAMKLGSETGSAGDGYTHPFTADNDPQTYTVEISRGDYAERFYGVRANEVRMMFEEAKLKGEIDVEAMGSIGSFTLAAAVTASVDSSLALSQDYDLTPNLGLVAGDILVIDPGTADEENFTILTVDADGFTVTKTGTVAKSHSAGAKIYLKKLTATFTDLPSPLMFGDMRVGYGVDATAAATAAASKSTATPVFDFTLTFSNNLLVEPTSNSRSRFVIKPRQRSCMIELRKLFSGPDQVEIWKQIDKQALVIDILGKAINLATPTHNRLTITLYKVLLEDNDIPLNAGEYLDDEQTFRAAYDSTATKAIAVSLVNTKASY